MKLYAVLGEKLSHTLSPQIHNFLLNKLNINGSYGVIEAKRENISKIIDSLKVLGYEGINVTIPYKESIMPYINEISEEAKSIGAVNTIKIKDGKSYGYNTDYYGFGKMLEIANIDAEGKDVVILGAGGAAKALIAFLHDAKVKSITVFFNSEGKITAMKKQFPYIKTNLLREINSLKLTGDIVVNATPVGMYPKIDDSIISEDLIKSFNAAVDIIYNPLETKFLKFARKNGLITADGLNMLIFQAIKAEEIFQNMKIENSLAKPIYHMLSEKFLA